MNKIEKDIILPVNHIKLWHILFDNDYVKRYMGCSLEKKDNQILWYSIIENQKVILLYGNILKEEQGKFLEISTTNPHRNYDKDYPLLVTYQLIPISKEKTKLSIFQTGFDNLPDRNQVYQENQKGWDFALDNLRSLISEYNNR
jgi:uncharacterized protein YndB with AHSA1/START domain